MHKHTVHYVIFWSPGSFVANEQTMTVQTSDPRKVAWPDNAYAFRLFRREDVIDGDKTYEGKPEQIGPIYYHPASVVQSLDEVRANPRATPILLDNMRFNGWEQIIWTRWMNWPQHFDPATMEILTSGGERG